MSSLHSTYINSLLLLMIQRNLLHMVRNTLIYRSWPITLKSYALNRGLAGMLVNVLMWVIGPQSLYLVAITWVLEVCVAGPAFVSYTLLQVATGGGLCHEQSTPPQHP